MHHIFFSQGFVLFSFKMSLMLSLPIVSNPFFFLSSSQRSVSDHLLRPSGQGVHANAITSATCFSLYFLGLPGLGLSLRALWRPSSAYLFLLSKQCSYKHLMFQLYLCLFFALLPEVVYVLWLVLLHFYALFSQSQ